MPNPKTQATPGLRYYVSRISKSSLGIYPVYGEPIAVATVFADESLAHLIAAAPQMREALEALVERATDWAAGSFEEYTADEIADARAALRAAGGE